MDSDSSDDNTDTGRLYNAYNIINLMGTSFVLYEQGICLFAFTINFLMQRCFSKKFSFTMPYRHHVFLSKERKACDVCRFMNITLHPAPPGILLNEL